MSNDETQRGYPLPSPDNIAYDDAKRIRDAILLINDDMTELDEREATEEHRGNVQLATAAEATAGTALNRVAAVKRVKDMIASAVTALQNWVAQQLSDLETDLDHSIDEVEQTVADLTQSTATALAGKVSTSAVGSGGNKIVAFDASGKYPAADGSALTGLNVPDNLIVNPTFEFSTVPGETADGPMSYGPGTAAPYVLDQWRIGYSLAAGGGQVSWQASAGPAGSRRRLRFTCTTAAPSLGAGDYFILFTTLEAVRVRSIKFAEPGASAYEIQVGFKAPAGTYQLRVGNGNTGNRYFRTSVTIAAGEANVDTAKRVTIPADVAGTWNLSEGFGTFTISITLAAGSGQQVAYSGAWGSEASLGAAGQFNLFSSTSNVIEIFETGMWKGKGPLPYKLPDMALERRWIERYYEVIYGAVGIGGQYCPVYFREVKRTTPTVTTSMGGNATVQLALPQGAYLAFVNTNSGYVYANSRF